MNVVKMLKQQGYICTTYQGLPSFTLLGRFAVPLVQAKRSMGINTLSVTTFELLRSILQEGNDWFNYRVQALSGRYVPAVMLTQSGLSKLQNEYQKAYAEKRAKQATK